MQSMKMQLQDFLKTRNAVLKDKHNVIRRDLVPSIKRDKLHIQEGLLNKRIESKKYQTNAGERNGISSMTKGNCYATKEQAIVLGWIEDTTKQDRYNQSQKAIENWSRKV